MTREEAINKVRQMSLPKETMDILEALAPELRESEDERMIKAITHILYENYTDAAVIEGVEIAEIVAWLEKQKDCFLVPKSHMDPIGEPGIDGMKIFKPGHYFYDGEKMHFCSSPVMEEKQKPMYNLEIPAGDVAPAEEDGPSDDDYCYNNDEKIRKSLIEFLTEIKEISESGRTSWAIRENDAEMCKSFLDYLKKQKKQKLNPDKEELIRRCIGSILTDATDERFKDYGLTLKDCLTWLDEQEEQQSVEWEWPNLSNCIRNCKKCHGKCFYRKEPYEEQKPAECIEFTNEFENEVSHLLASVLNGEWEYNEGFVKHAAQSLLGYAKNELKPDEWIKREKLFMKALQTTNAQIGELVEENYKLKEQKSDNYSEERKLNHEWTSEDWSMLCDIRRYIEGTGSSSGITNQERAAWLCELPKRFSLEGKEQKPAEWSEEDEQRIAEIEFAVMQMNTKRVDTKDKCLAWLKSLRPQQKVEWSDEDADMLNCCISSIEEAKENRYAYKETDGDTSYDREIDWLKSLRPS